MKKTLLILSLSILFASNAQNQSDMKTPDTTPIENFDLNKYLGKWYEIARFQHPFEKNLEGVTATYSLKPSGMVNVQNAGYFKSLDGKYKTASGKAKFAGKKSTGHLKVSFFLFFYGDYYIMKLDKDYQWALVGGSTEDYLWILSRSPQLPEEVYEDLLSEARKRGYDLSKLHKVEQPLK